MKWAWRAALVACVLAGGCRVSPRANDPDIQTRPANAALLRSPVVHLHIASVNNEEIPEEALEATLRTLSRHIRAPIEVHRRAVTLVLPTEPHMDIAAEFPVFDGDQLLTGAAFPPIDEERSDPPRVMLERPDNGLIGIMGAVTTSDPASGKFWYTAKPIVEDNVILVLVTPGNQAGTGHTGFTTTVVRGAGGLLESGMVVLRANAIRRRAGVFVPEERMWEWTLTHEIGHVLKVPADPAHGCIVPGYGGVHCTHPECVMYTGVDWRVFASGLINGWPLDYCKVCSSEIAAARGDGELLPPVRSGRVTFGDMEQ